MYYDLTMVHTRSELALAKRQLKAAFAALDKPIRRRRPCRCKCDPAAIIIESAKKLPAQLEAAELAQVAKMDRMGYATFGEHWDPIDPDKYFDHRQQAKKAREEAAARAEAEEARAKAIPGSAAMSKGSVAAHPNNLKPPTPSNDHPSDL